MGRKRHAMVDTDGRALIILVHPADVQDRDGAVPLLQQSHQRHPFVARAYADSAYNSDRVRDATSITIEIVRKFADQTGFVVHPRRWIIERTFRSEEHTSELQSLMRIPYAVFCLKNKNTTIHKSTSASTRDKGRIKHQN